MILYILDLITGDPDVAADDRRSKKTFTHRPMQSAKAANVTM